MAEKNQEPKLSRFLKQVICPHCWSTFSPSDVLWIASSSLLIGDFRLGDMEYERFLPTRYTAEGHAIDRQGGICREFACPYCHLRIPAPTLEMRPFFASVVGAPASGKSYFLASMTRRLSEVLPSKFLINITDADPQMNLRLREYESLQFLNDDENKLVQLSKTELQGDLYNQTILNEENVTLLQPFIFSLQPLDSHPNSAKSQLISRSLCLYDNAGESYLPDKDSDRNSNPVTRHLGKSDAIFFLFDPLQDNRFRSVCRKVSQDPQLISDTTGDFRKSPVRQEMILAEMIKRTRLFRSMKITDKYSNPVIVIVTKADAWRGLVPKMDFSEPYGNYKEFTIIQKEKIQANSQLIRTLLRQYTPEIIGSIEQFASDVTYIPISATGISPTIDKETKESGFRSKDLHPLWSEVPLLYALAQGTKGVIPTL